MANDVRHLSDEEIDLYASRRLDAVRVQAVEVHYLECAKCLARVSAARERAERGGDGSTGEPTA